MPEDTVRIVASVRATSSPIVPHMAVVRSSEYGLPAPGAEYGSHRNPQTKGTAVARRARILNQARAGCSTSGLASVSSAAATLAHLAQIARPNRPFV